MKVRCASTVGRLLLQSDAIIWVLAPTCEQSHEELLRWKFVWWENENCVNLLWINWTLPDGIVHEWKLLPCSLYFNSDHVGIRAAKRRGTLVIAFFLEQNSVARNMSRRCLSLHHVQSLRSEEWPSEVVGDGKVLRRITMRISFCSVLSVLNLGLCTCSHSKTANRAFGYILLVVTSRTVY